MLDKFEFLKKANHEVVDKQFAISCVNIPRHTTPIDVVCLDKINNVLLLGFL